jgi:spore coat polysaccharide biosynthesis predicted glycosyltransferase SpsG
MRIIYCASGEGMGHAIRSEAVIKELMKENKVIFCGGGKAYNHLKSIKEIDTYDINYFKIIYVNNKVAHRLTLI